MSNWLGTLPASNLPSRSNFADARQLQQSGNLLDDARNVIGGAVNSVENGLSGVLDGLFGSANSWATQIPRNIQDLCEP